MRCRARVTGLLIMTMVTSVLLALGTAGDQAAASGTTLTLYSGQHVQTTQTLVSAFERKTGITVNTRFEDEDVFVSQIETEGKNSPADVFFTENSPPLEELASKGLLSSVAPSTLAHTPSKYNSPGGKWVGISARVSVMIYNTSLIAARQLPTSIMDLAQPKWKGKIALAGAETDFQPIVTTVARTHGDAAALKWLEALKANGTNHLYPDSEAVANQVNRGQVTLGIINQYYWYRLRADVGASNMHSKIASFAPHDVGYVLDVSGAGILKSSKHQAAAQKFVAFLNSAQGQTIIAHGESFEYPIASGVIRTGETPFSKLQPNPVSIAELGTGAEAIKLLQEAQLL